MSSFFWIEYDIPDASGVENPSYEFRRIGFRSTLSCWIVPEDRIPWNTINGMLSRGCTVNIVKFDSSEVGKIIDMANRALQRDVKQIVEASERACRKAQTKYEERRAAAQDATEAEKALKAYERRTAASARQAQRLLAAAEEAAEALKLDKSAFPFMQAGDTVRALRTATEARARIYAGLTSAVQNTPYAAAAQANRVHPLILADMADDSGADDVITEAARLAFGS